MNRAAFASIVLFVLASFAACGKPPPPPKAAQEAEPEVAEDLPTWCTGGEKPCRPTLEFSKRLCGGSFPGAAVFLFQKSSPWQRRYVKAKDLDIKNPEGGLSGSELVQGEELIVLAMDGTEDPKDKKSQASYLVLRWDGSCAKVTSKETATSAPSNLKNSTVDYALLGPSLQRSLKLDDELSKAIVGHESACAQEANPECKKSKEKLSTLIVAKVRHGLKLSMPDMRP